MWTNTELALFAAALNALVLAASQQGLFGRRAKLFYAGLRPRDYVIVFVVVFFFVMLVLPTPPRPTKVVLDERGNLKIVPK